MEYGFDYIDNMKVPQMVIENDFTIQDKHDERFMWKMAL